MTSPVERAAEALATADRRLWSAASEKDREQYRDFVRAVFASIDPDELAQALRTATDNGADCTEDYAAAVKAWLTGKDQT